MYECASTVSSYTATIPWTLLQIGPESGQTLQDSLTAVSKPNFVGNIRWKALAEIYTMHSFAPFWNRTILIHKKQEKLSYFERKGPFSNLNFFGKTAEPLADF